MEKNPNHHSAGRSPQNLFDMNKQDPVSGNWPTESSGSKIIDLKAIKNSPGSKANSRMIEYGA